MANGDGGLVKNKPKKSKLGNMGPCLPRLVRIKSHLGFSGVDDFITYMPCHGARTKTLCRTEQREGNS